MDREGLDRCRRVASWRLALAFASLLACLAIGTPSSAWGASASISHANENAKLNWLEQAEALRRTAQTLVANGDRVHAIQTLNQLARLQTGRDALAQAEETYQSAFRLLRPEDAEDLKLLISFNYATLLGRMGDYLRAQSLLKDDIERARQANNTGIGIYARNSLANTELYLGNFDGAHRYWLEALALVPPQKPMAPIACSILNNLAQSYVRSGDAALAEEYFGRADGCLDSSTPAGRAALLTHQGKSRDRLHDRAGAISLLQKALQIYREIGDPGQTAGALAEIGAVIADPYYGPSNSDLDTAIGDFRQVVAERAHGGDRNALAVALNNLGATYTNRRDFVRAEKTLQEAETLWRQISDRKMLLTTLGNLAVNEIQAKRLAAAKATLRRLIRLSDLLRTLASDVKERIELFAQEYPYERMLVDILMKEGRPRDAFDVLEHGRARVLFDITYRERSDVLSRLPEALRRRLIAAEAAEALSLDAPVGTVDAEVVAQRERAEYDLLSVRADIDRSFPGVLTAGSQPPSVSNLQRLLPVDHAILEYAADPHHLHAFLVKRDHFESWSVDIPNEDLAKRALEFRRTIESRSDDVVAKSSTLYDTLIGGHASALRGVAVVTIIPDGVLRLIPFEALVTSSGSPQPHYLIESDFEIAYGTSAAILAIKDRRQVAETSKGILIVGNPTFRPRETANSDVSFGTAEGKCNVLGLSELPGTEKEAESIASIFGVSDNNEAWAVGGNASIAKLRSLPLEDYRYIHFATHGLLCDRGPLQWTDPVLALSDADYGPDRGLFGVGDVSALHLNADLVTLSGCQTVLGQDVGGEGIVGLPHAFLRAGARSVVASLWSVDDDQTARFMSRFYGLLHDGADKRTALIAAKRAMADGEANDSDDQGNPLDLRQPYFWAGFLLYDSRI